jgi:hypothetical protein
VHGMAWHGMHAIVHGMHAIVHGMHAIVHGMACTPLSMAWHARHCGEKGCQHTCIDVCHALYSMTVDP